MVRVPMRSACVVQISECPKTRAGAFARTGHRDESPESHLHCGSIFVSVSVSGWRGRWAVKTGYLRVGTRKSESELYNSNLLNTQVLSLYTHLSILSTNLARLDRGVPNGTRRDRASYGSGFQPTDSDSEPVSILGFGGKEGRVLQREVPVARSLRPEA